jgi:hypothetical protein
MIKTIARAEKMRAGKSHLNGAEIICLQHRSGLVTVDCWHCGILIPRITGFMISRKCFGPLTKEVVGIDALLTRSLFACDILRRSLQRVSLAKPTSAPVRF